MVMAEVRQDGDQNEDGDGRTRRQRLDTGQQHLELNCMSWVRGKDSKSNCSAFSSVKCT